MVETIRDRSSNVDKGGSESIQKSGIIRIQGGKWFKIGCVYSWNSSGGNLSYIYTSKIQSDIYTKLLTSGLFVVAKNLIHQWHIVFYHLSKKGETTNKL